MPAATAAAAGAPVGTGGASGGASPEVAADCQAVLSALTEATAGSVPAAPAPGEEITDEYKDAVQSLVDRLGDIDFQSDEVESAVEEQLGVVEDILDADEMTDELQSRTQDATTPLSEVCAPTFATSATNS